MLVMLLQTVKPSLRGELTRWMLELQPGVFVGTVSAMVRDRLWMKVCANVGKGGAVRIYSSNTEQGFVLEQFGNTRRELDDFDGLVLVKRLVGGGKANGPGHLPQPRVKAVRPGGQPYPSRPAT